MEIKTNVSLAFADFSVGNKILFGQKVGKCLTTENKTFPNLPIPVETLLETTSLLSEAEQDAMSGDSVAISKRKEINTLWNTQFRKTAAYVSFVADGNETLIKSTGFACTKGTRQKKGKIEMIDDFMADVKTAKGTAQVGCKSIKGASGYITIAADEKAVVSMLGDDIVIDLNGAQVRLKICTQSESLLTDLPSKTTVGISMAAFNSAGTSPLTDVQSITPQ